MGLGVGGVGYKGGGREEVEGWGGEGKEKK